MKTSCLCLIAIFCLVDALSESKAYTSYNYVNYIRKEGYCMWYGQCGTNPSTGQAVNCLYNGPAKPVDENSQKILAQLCPEFAHKDSKVCCDYKQVKSLSSGIQSAQEMMTQCPSCWKNFRELYCRMTCSPNNSMFISVTQLSPDSKSIISIDYYVEKAFRDGLYNSCKNVEFPSSKRKIMSFMCGTSADNCTPLKFLRFMGNPVLNGVSPFLVSYPSNSSGRPAIKAMNTNIKLCNESVFDPFTNTTKPACSCTDCWESCHLPFPIKLEYLAAKIIFSLKPSSQFNKRSCYKNFYSSECILTGTILRLDLLQKVLKVQAYLMNMSADFHSTSEKISLGDFCLKPPYSSFENCTVLSVLQYWQNDAKKLNKCITVFGRPCPDPTSFAKQAGWGDHLHRCAFDPYLSDDGTGLRLSCKSFYGLPVYPEQVLGGYENKEYDDASLLFVTFAMRKYPSQEEIEKAKVWQEKFVAYLQNYDDDDLQVAYVPFPLSSVSNPHTEPHTSINDIDFGLEE